MTTPIFRNRLHAGQALAERLATYAGRNDVHVLALPRGGVPVGFEVAQALGAPLDVLVARKLGVPQHSEYAMGALARGVVLLDEDLLRRIRLDEAVLQAVIEAEQRELERRERLYRGDQPPPMLHGRIAILVDDGLATGATMRAAARALRAMGPARSVVAVPVAAADTCSDMHQEADEVVCAATPEPFRAVGCWYGDFSQTGDEEVQALLARSARRRQEDTP